MGANLEIAKRDKIIAELKAENDKLKAKLNANSKNSSKPPSFDGFKMLQKADLEVACLPSLC